MNKCIHTYLLFSELQFLITSKIFFNYFILKKEKLNLVNVIRGNNINYTQLLVYDKNKNNVNVFLMIKITITIHCSVSKTIM